MATQQGKKLVVVTGLSGSGKSIALNALEDQGFYCVDNLPVSLLGAFAEEAVVRNTSHYQKIAIGVDARSQASELKQLAELCRTLRGQDIHCEILYLEAQDEILLQRFSETRRRHPLSSDNRTLADAISLERDLLEPLLSNADLRLDTTHTNVHQLRELVRDRVADRSPAQLSLLIQSFGFKHGLPRDADFVYDVRCLPNPHWQPELRPLTGCDRPVADFLETEPRVGMLLEHIQGFLDRWIPCFEDEGRSYLTVAVGCTGGQHRSVYLAERISAHFSTQGRAVLTRHRELS
jgi:UPF0042 nucleotide-binding protein